jgi:hypothetical protein
MYFTLAISAATAEGCTALVRAAQRTDPRVMPLPGPASIAWRGPDKRAAVLHWGRRTGSAPAGADSDGIPENYPEGRGVAASHAGTIWADPDTVCARTGLARIDPVYLAETPGAVVVSDRACWAAAVTGRLCDHDPVMAGALLSLGYPVGAATPFRGVRALDGERKLRAAGGRLLTMRARDDRAGQGAGRDLLEGAGRVAAALVEAVRPLAEAAGPVELSLTGGKDSRLIAAALTAAGVRFRARTHGFASHPDVIIAAMIAERLGVEHTVTEPRSPGTPDEADVLGRLRSAVLVSDGMLSAFENLGSPIRPDTRLDAEPVRAGGHGGELLRGGYAQAAWRARIRSAGAAELFRRMTTRRLGLLRPAAAGAYLASLAPSAAALARGPLPALDDFYLVNRAGRWSAAARQAYLLRSALVQPFFADRVVRAARRVPLRYRMSDRLHREVLASLRPELLDVPLAGSPWHGEPRTAANVLAAPAATADWRRDYGEQIAGFLRSYVLDHGDASPMFGIVSRRAAERSLRSPQADPHAVWSLATLAALLSGDWLDASDSVSRGRTASRPARSTARPRPA